MTENKTRRTVVLSPDQVMNAVFISYGYIGETSKRLMEKMIELRRKDEDVSEVLEQMDQLLAASAKLGREARRYLIKRMGEIKGRTWQ